MTVIKGKPKSSSSNKGKVLDFIRGIDENDDNRVTDYRKHPLPKSDNFYVPPSDEQGHGTTMHFRIPPIMAAILKQIPYDSFLCNIFKTPTDVIRWSILEGITSIRTWDNTGDNIKSSIGGLNAMLAILRDDEEGQLFLKAFGKLSERVQFYLGQGKEGEGKARKLLLEVIASLDDYMPEGYLRNKAMEQINNHWGHLLKGVNFMECMSEGEDGKEGDGEVEGDSEY